MRTFYRLNNKKILDFCEFEDGTNVPAFIEAQYIETDRKIVRVYNGTLMFEDETVPSDFVAPIEEIKQAKLVELKSMRDSLEVEPIGYNGNYFDYDEKARDRINAAIISLELLGSEASLSWTTADNDEAMVTANDLKMVIANVAIRSNELHVKYRTLREQVDKATTIEEINAINW